MVNTLINELGGFSQVGMIVRDVDETMRVMIEKLGIGPFFVAREAVPEDFHYRGEPSKPPVMTMAFAQSGPIQIELIQQHNDAPSAYTEFLGAGREGCQHFSIWFDDRDAYALAREKLVDRGFELVHEAGQAASQRFAYFATDVPGGLMIELAEARTPIGGGLMDAIAAASEGWDGSEPIRNL